MHEPIRLAVRIDFCNLLRGELEALDYEAANHGCRCRAAARVKRFEGRIEQQLCLNPHTELLALSWRVARQCCESWHCRLGCHLARERCRLLDNVGSNPRC